MNRKWTNEEVKFLEENYPLYGRVYCAEKLNRTPKAIGRKSDLLGIAGKGRLFTHQDYENKLMEIESSCYPVEKYVNNNTPILHACIAGHEWLLRPKHALEGRSCPSCANHGFNPSKPAVLYYISITEDNLKYYKVGITNGSVQSRFAKDMRTKQVKVLKEIRFTNGRDAKDMENLLLNEHPRVTVENFLVGGGNTELFEYDVLQLDKG